MERSSTEKRYKGGIFIGIALIMIAVGVGCLVASFCIWLTEGLPPLVVIGLSVIILGVYVIFCAEIVEKVRA